MYGKGISREGSLLDVGIDLGIVKKSGAWFTYDGEQLGQGREKAKQFLTENLDLMFEISEKIKRAVGIEDVSTEPEDAESETTDASGNGRGGKGKRAGDTSETLKIDN
jgi:recombination protein RecA